MKKITLCLLLLGLIASLYSFEFLKNNEFLENIGFYDTIQNLYFDIGFGYGISSSHNVFNYKHWHRHYYHNYYYHHYYHHGHYDPNDVTEYLYKREDIDASGRSSFDYGFKVGFPSEDLPMFYTIEFLHQMRGVTIDYNPNRKRSDVAGLTDIFYHQFFLGPGAVCYMGNNFQLAASVGLTFGSATYNYKIPGKGEIPSVKWTTVENFYDNVGITLSMAYDLNIMDHNMQVGLGIFNANINQKDTFNYSNSFSVRLFFKYSFYDKDRVRAYYDRW